MRLVLTIKPDVTLFCFAAFLYIGSVIAIVMTPLYFLLYPLLLLAVFFHAYKYVKRNILLTHPRAVKCVWKNYANFWSLQMTNKEVVNGFLKENSLVTHFLCVLNFRCEQQLNLTVIITPNHVGFDDYRRLMIILIHSKRSFN